MYTISVAKQEDAPLIASLVNSAYRGDSSKAGWTTEADLLDGTRTDAEAIKDLINQPGTVVLSYTFEGEISACVELQVQNETLYLGMLTVKPTLQGGGIGKILLKAAEQFARDNKCKSITMTVISVRTELIDWYKRHGFIDTGKRKPFNFSDPRFGVAKKPLEFVVLEKSI